MTLTDTPPRFESISPRQEAEANERHSEFWERGYLAFHEGKRKPTGGHHMDRIAWQAGWDKAEEEDFESAEDTVVVSAVFLKLVCSEVGERMCAA